MTNLQKMLTEPGLILTGHFNPLYILSISKMAGSDIPILPSVRTIEYLQNVSLLG